MYSLEQLKKELVHLLKLKRRGELDGFDKPLIRKHVFWREFITYDTLQCYVYHDDEQVRLNTLALVVESKKSTLKFTSKELDLITLFLEVNIKEKLEFVPLIKKALKRMKEGLAVIRRKYIHEEMMRDRYKSNCDPSELDHEILGVSYRISLRLQKEMDMYYKAFQSLHAICICNPDATYYRRKSSLQILLLMRTLLSIELARIPWNFEEAQAVFKLILLDTYESNKEMAFSLIKSIEPHLLLLNQPNIVRDIITVAIELGNSIRPIDSITAAYMLKISTLSPIIHVILKEKLDLFGNTIDSVILGLILTLLEKLKQSLILAKENLVTTVAKHSLYGYIFCIRTLIDECDLQKAGEEKPWQDTIAELVSTCLELSEVVSVIVNNSSPEGHLPMDLQIIDEIKDSSSKHRIVTPQMVLLCSWRTVKEVSLLFGSLVAKAPIRKDDSSPGLLNKQQIIQIGEHLVTLLTETKHRGAFEQAHVGFDQLCSRLWRLKIENLNRLPIAWLHQILIAIAGIKEENSKLCATRRSAGVPFMIQALLSTEPRQYKDTNTTVFHAVMTILLKFTRLETTNLRENLKRVIHASSVFSEYENSIELSKINERPLNEEESVAQVTEIRTHALNILRAIFRNSQLGELVNKYVEDGLISAIKSYDALTWAERNAATLLFSALIIRVFGVQRTKDHINLTTDNKMNFATFFHKCPNLLPFMLNELQTFVMMKDTLIKSNVQSILLLLSRLYHSQGSEMADVESKVDDFVDLIIQCAKSAVFETRKLAARALVPLLTPNSAKNVLQTIIVNAISTGSNNSSLNLVHGYMLQIFEILQYFGVKQFLSADINLGSFLHDMSWIFDNLQQKNSKPPCFLLATVYVDICNEVYKADKTYYCGQCSRIIRELISHFIDAKLKQGPSRELYQTSAIKLIQHIAETEQLIPEPLLITIYIYGLNIPETEIIVWSIVTKIISQMNENTMSSELLNYGFNRINNSINDLHGFAPDLQDAIFDFLYHSIIYLEKFELSSVKKAHICKLILNEVRSSKKKDTYCERDHYLRLLGKSYASLCMSNEEKDVINLECTSEVFNNFCDNLWIASLSTNLRNSVFSIMNDLFLTCIKIDEYRYAQVQWWTTMLQLLLDNNSEVRRQASILIRSIPVLIRETTNRSSTNVLLSKFYESMRNTDPELICVVLFYWSVALIDYSDYEMDETDVFNKCTNYDFYEPVEVSKVCVDFLERNLGSYLDNVLSDETINWLNSRLDVEFDHSITFRTLIKNYGNYIPIIDNKIRNLLDPTFKSRLLKVLTYREYERIL